MKDMTEGHCGGGRGATNDRDLWNASDVSDASHLSVPDAALVSGFLKGLSVSP